MISQEIIDLDRFCRLCLSEEHVTSHLFDNPHDDANDSLCQKVITCLSVKITRGDGLPAMLCQTCVQHINTLCYFKELSKFVDTTLRHKLLNNKKLSNNDWEKEIKLIVEDTKALKASKPNLIESCSTASSKPTPLKIESDCNYRSDADCEISLPNAISSLSDQESIKSNDIEEEEQTVESPSLKKKKRFEYTCEFCGRTFPRSNHLAQHELTHVAEKPFHCSECDKSFWYKQSLIGHIKQTHTGDVDYKCELCGKGFFKKTELTRHRPTHSNETPHKCPQCGMGFKITKTLKRHIRNVHTAQRSYTCHMCGKSFIQAQTLKVHMVLHSGVKPYTCSYCGKGFAQSAPLKTHIRIHTGEKPFSCHVCGDCFSTRSALNSHAFKHSDNFPYHCTRCSETFRLKRDLIQHEQGHDDHESFSQNSIKQDLNGSFCESQESSTMASATLHNLTFSQDEDEQDGTALKNKSC
ncbi:zinc finger protein 93-like isoform X2 [Frankliniella occidentalis]|uniref:Zinc finger protein 93-like isoform X2 n=1 Tax=Frankliniella occidentalis TaxID=133901 RepID=A0A9C6X6C6_FRAOC|nr:zinc finger protein 93-like isoform X2 [Frankliniella occidentalis]